MTNTNDSLLSKRRAAAEARVSPQTVERWIKLGNINPIQDGKRLKIRRSELDAVAGLTAESLLHQFLPYLHELRQENIELRERLARVEERVFGKPANTAMPPALLPSAPRRPSKSEIARLIARHSQGTIKVDTVMRSWFKAIPPCPLDPGEALKYAEKHCATVGHRGHGQMVTRCSDHLCICARVLASEAVSHAQLDQALSPK